jgi:hypothetical protein
LPPTTPAAELRFAETPMQPALLNHVKLAETTAKTSLEFANNERRGVIVRTIAARQGDRRLLDHLKCVMRIG